MVQKTGTFGPTSLANVKMRPLIAVLSLQLRQRGLFLIMSTRRKLRRVYKCFEKYEELNGVGLRSLLFFFEARDTSMRCTKPKMRKTEGKKKKRGGGATRKHHSFSVVLSHAKRDRLTGKLRTRRDALF